MKKLLLILFVLVLICLAGVYLLFPSKHALSGTVSVGAALPLVARQLPDTANWAKWWPWPYTPGVQQQSESTLMLKGVADLQLVLMWYEGRDSIPVALNITSKGNDTSLIIWTASVTAGANPINRVSGFARSQRLKNDMQNLLHAFGVYASDPQHAYGFTPVYTEVADTMLISTKATFANYPTTAELYGLFGSLEKYALSKGAAVSGLPMYHVEEASSEGVMVMAALPINRLIANTGSFQIKRMIDGHLLVAEVQAGPAQLQHFFAVFEQYKTDHQLVSPAIPYLQPVTNRLQQADTAQWVTKMCYPIF